MKGLELPYLIACILRYAAKPFHDDQLIKRYIESQGGLFKCPTCAKLPESERKGNTRDRAFGDRGKLNRHLKEVHTKWLDLALEMVTEDPGVFVCPSGDYAGSSIVSVRKHCISKNCMDRNAYLDLLQEAKIKVAAILQLPDSGSRSLDIDVSTDHLADKADEELE